VCPNYGFPYEQDFDMPTLLSKSLTWRFLQNRILNSRTVLDPRGTWQSLNWISVSSVKSACRRDLGIEPEFDRTVFFRFVRRAIDDSSFQRRHSRLLCSLCASLDAVGVSRLLAHLPAEAQPALSCRIARPG
jgi:hypothetical protein